MIGFYLKGGKMKNSLKINPYRAHLWQHPNNGVWYVRWRQDGKGRRKSLKTNEKRAANRRFNNFVRDLISGKVKPIGSGYKISFYEFVDEFLQYIGSTTEHSTYILYEVALEKAKSCWGDIPLAKISTKHIDTLIADMLRAELARPTVNKNRRHIKSALSKAYDWEYLQAPVRFPKPLKEKKRTRFLSKAELRKLMKNIDDLEFSDFCLFTAYSGLRSGEMLRLTWKDIDNPKGFLRIISEQKNKKEDRIPINKNMRAIIKKCSARRKDCITIFRFKTRTWVSQKFKGYARNADLEKFRFHDLRHTFASHLTMEGETLKAVKELMRHGDVSSTMIYANISPEYLKKASEKLNYGPMPIKKKKKKKR